uniref:Uncharacterized protein n=1 Tax=Schistosoma haematobium TaxID=6185 RepID=A0A095AM96_SCHHA
MAISVSHSLRKDTELLLLQRISSSTTLRLLRRDGWRRAVESGRRAPSGLGLVSWLYLHPSVISTPELKASTFALNPVALST